MLGLQTDPPVCKGLSPSGFGASPRAAFPKRQHLTMEAADQVCPPVVVIGGTSSGVGKTSLSVGLMAALRRVPLDTKYQTSRGA